jgi:hypothetical protein
MINLTATQEITPYQWVHPDEERDRREASFLFVSGLLGRRMIFDQRKSRSRASSATISSGKMVFTNKGCGEVWIS